MKCYHPNWIPNNSDEIKPEPAEMIGCCSANMVCPICGFGWGQVPHICKEEDDKYEVTHKRFFGENIKRAINILKS